MTSPDRPRLATSDTNIGYSDLSGYKSLCLWSVITDLPLDTIMIGKRKLAMVDQACIILIVPP
jgi:hypothetical protein